MLGYSSAEALYHLSRTTYWITKSTQISYRLGEFASRIHYKAAGSSISFLSYIQDSTGERRHSRANRPPGVSLCADSSVRTTLFDVCGLCSSAQSSGWRVQYQTLTGTMRLGNFGPCVQCFSSLPPLESRGKSASASFSMIMMKQMKEFRPSRDESKCNRL